VQRAALVDRIHAVYSETMSGFTRDELEAQIFGAGEPRVGLFYGARGELAGFTYAGLDRLEHQGRRHGMFSMGAFFRYGYRGGLWTTLFGLRVALLFKLREPRTPVAYLTRCATPAAYRRLVLIMPTVYPHRTRRTPAKVASLIHALTVQWNYEPVGEDMWVVRSVATPRDVARLRRIAGDAESQFYLRLNPHFAEGRSLVVFTPLTAVNIAGGIFRATCTRGRRR